MRKLVMSLFLLVSINLLCSAYIDGYFVKDGFRYNLFADGEPRTYTEIGVEAGKNIDFSFMEPSIGGFYWETLTSSSDIQFYPGTNGRFSHIATSNSGRGESASFKVTAENGDVLTIVVCVY